jgi:RNA recognition motif-containing protein
MSKKLFVGNLPFSTTDESLKAEFSKFGAVSEAVIIKNKFNNRSKGFGFVTFDNDAEADEAIAKTNGMELEGRKMTVNVATPFNPDAPRKPRFGGERRSFGGNRSGGFGNRSGGFKKFGDKKKENSDGDDDFDADDNQSFGSDF